MWRLTGAVAILSLALPACDGRSGVQPTPSAALFPAFYLSGRVVDTAYRPLAGSKVEIMTGERAGTIETTDDAGNFSFPGFFTEVVTMKASKEGYVPETRTVPPPNRPPEGLSEGSSWYSQLYLAPLGPPADLAGVYSLTLTADSSCRGLSADLRTRSYTATITPAGRLGFFMARLSDATFFTEPCQSGRAPESCTHNQFSIGVAGDFARIGIGVIEQLGDRGFLWFEAGTEGSIGERGISAPFDGSFMYCPEEPTLIDQGTWACLADGGAQCESHTHQLSLTRR